MGPKSPPLETLLSGVPADELEELYKTLRDRKVKGPFLANLLDDYKREVETDRAFAPIAKEGRAFTATRQRLRKRLLKIMNETIALYEKEVHPERLEAQAGYRAGRAMLAALVDRHDSIVGPSMGLTPKSKRGPRKRPAKARVRKMLGLVGLGDLATFLLDGLFLTKKKK